MEFGREVVADYLAKNKIPKIADWKVDFSGWIDGMMDFNSKLDEIARDIRVKKDNAMAMEFVKVIGGMLVNNGVSLKIEECRDEKITMNMAANKIEVKYGVRIDGLDFSEHDKVFEDKIAELKKDYKSVSGLVGNYQQENESLKQRISEIENFSCQAEQESESMIEKLRQHISELKQSRSEWVDKAVEWQQKCEKLESEKEENFVKEPISDDCRPSIEWYENRYQSDCIEINRLNTTIDVLIHKIEYLRQYTGLE